MIARRQSSISADAGDGVFATADIAAGEAVTFFPGRVFVPPPLITLADGGLGALPLPCSTFGLGEDTARRRDDMVLLSAGNRIDGSYFEEREDAATGSDAAALGHIINHPPRGTAPNVAASPLQVELTTAAAASDRPTTAAADLAVLEVPSASPAADLLRRVFEMDPDGWYVDVGGGGAVVPHGNDVLCGAVMVAIAPVARGAELFFDYNLRATRSRPLPEWYDPVDWRW